MKYFIKLNIYIIVKYFFVFAYNFSFSTEQINLDWAYLQTGKDWFYFLWMFFSLPLLEGIILFFPFKMALKYSAPKIYLYLIFIFLLEFFLTWAITNQQLENWMIIKIIISVMLFFIVFQPFALNKE